MKNGRWVLIVLGALTVGSLWRTVSVEQDKQRLSQSYQQAQQVVAELDRERTLLSDEVETARKSIKDQGNELTSLQTQLTGVQNRLDETVAATVLDGFVVLVHGLPVRGGELSHPRLQGG